MYDIERAICKKKYHVCYFVFMWIFKRITGKSLNKKFMNMVQIEENLKSFSSGVFIYLCRYHAEYFFI